jgi:2-oxoglutarate ferredoxin oxidoreductase subunit gamma
MSLKRILIAGEGGQGIQALAHIFVGASFEEKQRVSYLPNFGVEQRGGVSLAFIQVSKDEISFPKFSKADIVILFAPRAVSRIEQYLKKGTVLIFDNSLVADKLLEHIKLEKVAIPASSFAKQKLIPRVFNIIMLGALAAETKSIKTKSIEKEIEKFFGEKIKKEPELKHFNLAALKYGYETVNQLNRESKWRKSLLKK